MLRALELALQLQISAVFSCPEITRRLSDVGFTILSLICQCGRQRIPKLLSFHTEIQTRVVDSFWLHRVYSDHLCSICPAYPRLHQTLWICNCVHICSALPIPLSGWFIAQKYCFIHCLITKSKTKSQPSNKAWETAMLGNNVRYILRGTGLSAVSAALRTTWGITSTASKRAQREFYLEPSSLCSPIFSTQYMSF